MVSSSAFAAFADDDDVRRIRFRCVPEEDNKEEEEAQKRPPLFKARGRIDCFGENDAPLLLDIIIIIVLL